MGPFCAGRRSPCSDCHASEAPDHWGTCFTRSEKGPKRHRGAGAGAGASPAPPVAPTHLPLVKSRPNRPPPRSPGLALCELRREGKPRPRAPTAPRGRQLTPACPGPSCFGTEGPAFWESPVPLANPGGRSPHLVKATSVLTAWHTQSVTSAESKYPQTTQFLF